MNRVGIDIGSTTVKIAILDDNNQIIFSAYERHFANIQETLKKIIERACKELGNREIAPMITGSGGLAISKHLDIPFVQEVVSVATALKSYAPNTDVAIELGGCKNHLLYRRYRTTNEWHLYRWYRFVYRPDGYTAKNRCCRIK